MRILALALISLAAIACGDEDSDPYKSDYCKGLRVQVRQIELVLLQFPDSPLNAALLVKRATAVQENPECFDASL